MKPNLRLRREALAELTPAELASAAGGQEAHTVTVCISHVCPVLKAVGELAAASGSHCTTEC